MIRTAEREAYARFGGDPEERQLEVEGAGGRTTVRVLAFNPDSDGPPVVLLHGIASISVLAAPLLPYLRGRPVYAVDWPGHGLSGACVLTPGLAFRTHAVSVLEGILDGLGLEVADLVGHSMGGQISLYGAIDLPDRLRRIVLLGAPGASLAGTKPIPVMKLLAIPKVGEAMLSMPMSERTFERTNDLALGKGALREMPPELVETAYLLAGRASNAASIASFFRALIRRGSIRRGVVLDTADLGRVSKPTLMVWGDEDPFLTPTQAAESIAAISDVRLVPIAGAGHAPWLQAPDIAGESVAQHLTQDDGPSRVTHIPRRAVMTEPVRVDFSSAGGAIIAAYRWTPPGDPRAIVQLAHGVGEYALRYTPLAEYLVAQGFVVYAHDHRGHGSTPGAGDAPGALGEGGWVELVQDIGRMGEVAKSEHPDLKLALVAHSLGSFATQQFLLDNSDKVDAVALSGTAAIDLLEPALDLDAPMDLAMFNAAFQPARTEFDWLSRDEEQVDLYLADPGCGFGLDVPGGKSMFEEARQLADPNRVANMRGDLPVYITVGDMDPVNGQLALVHALVERYEKAGITDVTLKAYEGARHEVFNETNRAEVFADLLAWLDSKVSR